MTPIREQLAKRWKWLVLAVLVAIFLVVYLPCAVAILYNYYWWIRNYHTVQYAAPVTVPEGAEPMVPKILHQTWKNKEVPEKWKAAQQSCIDRHPGYEYRLWTDEDAEKVRTSCPAHHPPTWLSSPARWMRS
jgi:inositol phosphorylceramide mannosyltransferase catalytic subunit